MLFFSSSTRSGSPMTFSRVIFASGRALFLAGLVGLSGCGGSGEERHQVSGSVTYQGKPLELGSISFEPDRTVVGFAPSSYTDVSDGKYSTKAEESPAKGKYRVRVLAFDKSKIDPKVTADMPPMLCPPFETTVEVPPPDGRLNIELPTAAESGKKR
jgi:hypothetical protein